MIECLLHNPKSTDDILYELTDAYIIQSVDNNRFFVMHEFIREYLYDRLDINLKKKSHKDAAKRYKQQADDCEFEYEKADLLAQAFYHFTVAEDWGELSEISRQTYEMLINLGDWDRALNIANNTLKAVKKKNDNLEICDWLIRIAEDEIDKDCLGEAEKHLIEMDNRLPKTFKITKSSSQILKLKAMYHLEYGRLEYYRANLESADKHFDQVLDYAKQSDDYSLEARCLLRIGRIERQRSQYKDASKHFKRAMKLSADMEDTEVWLMSVSHLGLIARSQNNKIEAERLFTLAYNKGKEVNDKRAIEINLSLLGGLALLDRDYLRAESIFRECLDLAREIGNPRGIRILLGQLGETVTYLWCL